MAALVGVLVFGGLVEHVRRLAQLSVSYNPAMQIVRGRCRRASLSGERSFRGVKAKFDGM